MKILIGLLLLSRVAFATDLYTLSSAKNATINENVKIAVTYEEYIMAKNMARAKALTLLPTLNSELLLIDAKLYTILRTVVPEPSIYFEYRSSKELSKAAEVNIEIVKRNLLEDIEKSYFTRQLLEESLNSIIQENEIHKEIEKRSEEAFNLGAISYDQLLDAKKMQAATEQLIIQGNGLLSGENFALKLILQSEDQNGELSFEKAQLYNLNVNFPTDVNQAMDLAVANSLELKQAEFLIQAARESKKGKIASFISWNGVGFDYFTNISISSHEVEKLKLLKQKSLIEIRNQVAKLYAQISNQKERIEYQNQILNTTKEILEIKKSEYNNQLSTLITVKRQEITLMQVQREANKLNYELEFMYLNLKRVMGGKMSVEGSVLY